MQLVEFDGLPEGTALRIGNVLVIGTAPPNKTESEVKSFYPDKLH
jgi:hypothetical protein